MKSTGEVLGMGKTFKEALFKGLCAAGYRMKRKGGVFISVRDSDKGEIAAIARKFDMLGFSLYATDGTANILRLAGMKVTGVNKIHENESDNSITLLESGNISYVLSTSENGKDSASDDVKIRRKACLLGIPCLTSLDTANAVADSLLGGYSEINTELININKLREKRLKLNFIKMQGCGNDNIFIDCFDNDIDCPESLTVVLSDRH